MYGSAEKYNDYSLVAPALIHAKVPAIVPTLAFVSSVQMSIQQIR